MMKLDLHQVAFSSFGSFLAITEGKLKDRNGSDSILYIRDLSGGDEDPGYICALEMFDTECNQVAYEYAANETELIISNDGKDQLQICFSEDGSLHFNGRCTNFGLRFILSSYDHINVLTDSLTELHSYTHHMKMMLYLNEGMVEHRLTWDKVQTSQGLLIFSGEAIDLHISRYRATYDGSMGIRPYIEDLEFSKGRYADWKSKMPSMAHSEYSYARDLAHYITYSCVTPVEGLLTSHAMYMSNNWMTNFWSWDNCFNAIALAKGQPELAFEQLMLFSAHQDDSGVLPDFMNNLYVSYDCTKPPVYGWAYLLMMKQHTYFHERAQLERIYPVFKGLEKYWTDNRVSREFPLPYYNHGNDSGWDNATVFSLGCPVSSPDLPCYLVLLYDALIAVSELLGAGDEKRWLEKKQFMLTALIENLYNGERFFSHVHGLPGHQVGTDSLINLMPIVVADNLPKDIVENLVGRLKTKKFLTSHGLATEAVDSPYYEEDGYWRGPIWAPVMLLVIDGLDRCGERKFAIDLARRFCDTCRDNGMAENFDPITGRPLVDPAFTWTSSVFLHLAHNYL